MISIVKNELYTRLSILFIDNCYDISIKYLDNTYIKFSEYST